MRSRTNPADSPPSVRPLRKDARENYDRILEAADVVFSAEGVGAPIDEIAQRAGLGVGTLYRHFPSKELLFEAVLERQMLTFVDLSAGLLAEDDPEHALNALLDCFVETAASKRDIADALTAAGIDVKSRLHGTIEQLHDAVRPVFERAQDAGVIRADITPEEFFGLASAVCMASEPSEASTRKRMLDVVRDGLRPGTA